MDNRNLNICKNQEVDSWISNGFNNGTAILLDRFGALVLKVSWEEDKLELEFELISDGQDFTWELKKCEAEEMFEKTGIKNLDKFVGKEISVYSSKVSEMTGLQENEPRGDYNFLCIGV